MIKDIKFRLYFVRLFLIFFLFLLTFHQCLATTASLGYWKLDEIAGTSVADSSSSGGTGTNHNATSSVDVPSAILFANDRSLIFNSVYTSYVDLPSTGIVGAGDAWTMCAWFKSTTSTALQDIYTESYAGSTLSVVTLQMNATAGKVRLFVRNDANVGVIVNASVTVNDGLWHFACGVKTSDTNYRLYVDNVQFSPSPNTASLGTISVLNTHAIGANKQTNFSRYFTGNIDDVRVYDRALSSAELTSLYVGSDIDSVVPTQTNATTSTMVAGTSTLSTSGIATTTSITVTIRNATSSPLVGEAVSLSSSRGGSDTIYPASVVTDANGVAVFVVRSAVVGTSVYTATVDDVTITETISISYTGVKTDTGVTYTSTLDDLSLNMDVSYDNSLTNLPIVVTLHGYSGPYTGDDIIERLASKGVFAIKTYKRGYGGSQGTQDDSGREIYDFYDAIEYVKANYSSYVDENNINVIGYSGGGGNTYGLITKFPDYFRSVNIFFGMSDYCYDSTYSWWYNGSISYRTGMQSHIGGTPTSTPDRCYARAHYLGAKNNPYSHIQLFYDTAESIVPPSHATQYLTQNNAAGLSNVIVRTSSSTSTTTELVDDFSTDLSDFTFTGDGTTKFTWNPGGYIDWVGDRATSSNAVLKKLSSHRSYSKSDRIKASFTFSITDVDTNGVILFGFRNSTSTAIRNAVSLIVVNRTPSVRIDYNGTTLDLSNRDFTNFATTLSTGTSYGVDLEMNNSVVTAILKDTEGAALETKTVSFDAAKGFDGVDAFGMYNFHNGDNLGSATGTMDNLSIDAYARWIHGYPQEGAGTPEGNITAENYFVPDIISGTWSRSTVNVSGNMFIPGYVKTQKFQVFLGNGNDEVGNLTYNISGSGDSISNSKMLTVEGLTGTSTISLKLYELTPLTQYNIRDRDLTYGGDTTSQAISDGSGTLTFGGTLGSTHQYDIYSGTVQSSGLTSDSIVTSRISTGYSSGYSPFVFSSPRITKVVPVYNFVRDLAFGSSGMDVKALQTFLISKRLLSAGNDIGYFGPMTEAALVRYQSSNGITPAIGYFGPITRSVIATDYMGLDDITSGLPQISTATNFFGRDMFRGVSGVDVGLLQRYLNDHNFIVAQKGVGSPGYESDYFGPATQAALIKFQIANNISPAIGYFGPKTRAIVNGQ
ncbi:MAG: LamG-like jellyroll fold domain-containing protein [Candidatus Paceibacterota bacterium]